MQFEGGPLASPPRLAGAPRLAVEPAAPYIRRHEEREVLWMSASQRIGRNTRHR